MKKGDEAEKPCRALSAIFDEPATLAGRFQRREPVVMSTLEDVANILSAETVGKGVKERFSNLSDQHAGKLLKTLLPLVSDAEIGKSMKTLFTACLEKLRQ